MTPKSGKAIAWLTFLLGILVSIAGNIGHAASDGMQPGEWAGAAFWPTALLLSVEILTRVRWQPERRWTVARFFGLLLVSVVAAILSYLHLRSLLIFWSYGKFQGSLGPLAVDGLMLIAASALLSISKERGTGKAPAVIRLVEETSATVVPVTKEDAEINDLVNALSSAPEPEPEPEPKPVSKAKVPTSTSVPASAAEEAAFQAWMNAPSGSKPSVRRLADMSGLSPSKAHRLITSWRGLETSR